MVGFAVINKVGRYFRYCVTLFIAVLVFSTNISASSLSHIKPVQEKGVQQGCSSICISHTPAAVVGDSTNKKDKEEKEPAPPAFTWIDSPYSLLALYLAPFVFFLIFIDRHRQLLLTTRLRF